MASALLLAVGAAAARSPLLALALLAHAHAAGAQNVDIILLLVLVAAADPTVLRAALIGGLPRLGRVTALLMLVMRRHVSSPVCFP